MSLQFSIEMVMKDGQRGQGEAEGVKEGLEQRPKECDEASTR